MYKVMLKERGKIVSPYKGMEYELGKWYTCEDFDADPRKDCSSGFYATSVEGLTYAIRKGNAVYECEVGGREVKYDIYKHRHEKIRLVRELTEAEVKELARNCGCGYNLEEVLCPINPLKIKREHGVTEQELQWLKDWASVRVSVGDSVRASVWDSVWVSVRASVGASVGDSVWDSVWDSVGRSVGASVSVSVRASVWDSVRVSVGDSVGASVWAYTSSLFATIKNWKYIDHAEGVNPFQPCINLWKAGLVPSCDGKVWRLHGGENAEIVWEGSL